MASQYNFPFKNLLFKSWDYQYTLIWSFEKRKRMEYWMKETVKVTTTAGEKK